MKDYRLNFGNGQVFELGRLTLREAVRCLELDRSRGNAWTFLEWLEYESGDWFQVRLGA